MQLNEKSFYRSGKILVNAAIISIIILTIVLSLILFISLIKVEFDFILALYNFFIDNMWFIFLLVFISVALIIVALVVFNIQMDSIFRDKIRTMYDTLSTNTIKGITNLPVGIISYSEQDIVLWINNFFSKKDKDNIIGQPIDELFPFLNEKEITDDGRGFVFFPDVLLYGKFVDVYQDMATKMFYLFDKSKEYEIAQKSEQERLVIGYIYVDSQEEMQVLEDAGNLEVNSEMHRIILYWAQKYNAYVRKYAIYRWMIVTNKAGLDEMCEDQMNVREEVKKLGKLLQMNITISGGFSNYTENIGEVVRQAIDAIELGQSRGGDQIVVHEENGENLIFGGDTNQKKRTSRVMARSTAISLHNALEKYENVYITGHQYADLDAIGAMLGIHQIVMAEKKKAHFILDQNKLGQDVKELFRKTWKDSVEYDELMQKIISPQRFKADEMPQNSVVIIVDTVSVALLETSQVLKAENIVIIDHHRKGKDAIPNALIEYIDPFSSSASEMVTELIQYQPLFIDIPREIATCLLAGIVLDTNKFTRNVSSRTFEAASYLRKQGALQEYVLQVLSTNIEDYIIQSNHLVNADSLPNNGKILALEGLRSRPEIAKCADFLLSFGEVKYTIVIAEIDEETIAVSARSKGAVNIQRIMEYFGGGGHYNNAAVQIHGKTLRETKQLIVDYIYTENEKKDE